MKLKSCLIMAIILSIICIMSVSSISAYDSNISQDITLENNALESQTISSGDFNSLNESIISDSEIILEGDINNNNEDNFINGIKINKQVTIDGKGNTINANSHSRIFFIESAGDLTLKNMVLTNGFHSRGGAIYVSDNAKLTLINVTFLKNKQSQALTFEEGKGGAIYNKGFINITNSTFDSNKAFFEGGAIYNNAPGSFISSNSTFTNNTAGLNGGALYLSNYYYSPEIIIDDSIFTKNTAVSGGAIYIYTLNKLSVKNSTFINNNARTGYGGAIYNPQGSIVDITKSKFFSNNAKYKGGALSLEQDSYVKYCVFAGNDAEDGKSVEITDNSTLDNCYFGSDNPAEEGLVIGLNPTNIVNFHIEMDGAIDYNNLTIGDFSHFFIKFIGPNLNELPSFDLYLSVNPNFLKFIENPKELIFSENNKVEFIATKSGDAVILASYPGGYPLAEINVTNEFIILKNYSLTIDVNDGVYRDSSNIKFSLFDEKNNPVDGSILVFLNDNLYNVSLTNGLGNLSLNLDAGNYFIEANYFTEDYFYNDAYKNASFKISKLTPDLNVVAYPITEGENAIIKVNMPSYVDGKVSIQIGGTISPSNEITLADGAAQFTVSGLTAGTKIFSVSYVPNANSNFNRVNSDILTLVVNTAKPVTPITPVDPITPVEPVTPITPVVPVTPDEPVTPVPVVPVNPVEPVTPINPDVPVVPVTPVEPVNPVNPVIPDIPFEPVAPVEPVTPVVPVIPDKPDSPNTPTIPEKPTVPDNSNLPKDNNKPYIEKESQGTNDYNKNDAVDSSVGDSDSIQDSSNSPDEGSEPQNRAYELQDKIFKVINEYNLVYAFIFLIIIALLLIIGYLRNREES